MASCVKANDMKLGLFLLQCGSRMVLDWSKCQLNGDNPTWTQKSCLFIFRNQGQWHPLAKLSAPEQSRPTWDYVPRRRADHKAPGQRRTLWLSPSPSPFSTSDEAAVSSTGINPGVCTFLQYFGKRRTKSLSNGLHGRGGRGEEGWTDCTDGQ